MSINLNTFNSGDTDYIAKLNANVAELTTFLNQLQLQLAAISSSDQISVGMFMVALFNNADALIGANSYKPSWTPGATSLTIAPGGAYLAADQKTVASFGNVTINFAGRLADVYYVKVDLSGLPTAAPATASDPGVIYSVAWSGTGFTGTPELLVPIFFDTIEADASRKSTALGETFRTIDDRMEALEAYSIVNTPVRKIGVTIDGTTGLKGSIQIDFEGVIIGWSITADVAGSVQVEVDRKSSSAPPSAPGIPNTTTDKISGSAPVALSAAQSASAGTAGVSTWTTLLHKWDVVQFNVASVTTLTKATLYLRIQELIPSP